MNENNNKSLKCFFYIFFFAFHSSHPLTATRPT